MTVAAWLIFLAILFGLFDYLVSQHNNPNPNILTPVNGAQKEIILKRNRYGHYVTNGSINNHDVIFLLDTGATEVAIPERLADKIGLRKGREFVVKTANGNVRAYRTHLDSVAIGDIYRYDLNATILTNRKINGTIQMYSFTEAISYKYENASDFTVILTPRVL